MNSRSYAEPKMGRPSVYSLASLGQSPTTPLIARQHLTRRVRTTTPTPDRSLTLRNRVHDQGDTPTGPINGTPHRELGFRFFTSRQAFEHYVEELLNIDLDGEGLIGPVSHDPKPTEPAESDEANEPGDAPIPASTKPPGHTDADLEAQFHRAMGSIYERARNEASYNPHFSIPMVSEQGGLSSARQLLAATSPSAGFTALSEAGRLDLTVEAVVIRPEYARLFAHRELRTPVDASLTTGTTLTDRCCSRRRGVEVSKEDLRIEHVSFELTT